jgi:hypothetical protein
MLNFYEMARIVESQDDHHQWLQTVRDRVFKDVPEGKVRNALENQLRKVEGMARIGLPKEQWEQIARSLGEQFYVAARQVELLAMGKDFDGIAEYYEGWEQEELRLFNRKMLVLSHYLTDALPA